MFLSVTTIYYQICVYIFQNLLVTTSQYYHHLYNFHKTQLISNTTFTYYQVNFLEILHQPYFIMALLDFSLLSI